MSRYDITTFGEGQIRLTVPKGERLSNSRELRMTAACSEANVCGLLAQLGRAAAWGSVIPHGALGERVLSEFRSVGIDLSHIIRVPESHRVALYFLEPGDPPMPAKVTYDRLHTAFRDIDPDAFDWDHMMDTRLVFVTGITTALTENTRALNQRAVAEAAQRGIEVALDVNHRTTLWSAEDAYAAINPMLKHVKVLFCSRTDGNIVFGIPGDGPTVCRELRQRTGVEYVISTDQVNGVYYSGPDGDETFAVQPVPVTDRPGAGDAFVAGTLHGFLDGDLKAGIRYGLRTAAIALTHHGDLTRISAADLAIPTSSDIVR